MSKYLIEATIYNLQNKQPYLGRLMQIMTTKVTDRFPIAGVRFDKKTRKFEMLINMEFFGTLTDLEREAVLIHEVLHILHKHTAYMIPESPKDKNRMNIAMDLVINQLITDLPKDCMFIENFKDKKGKPFPPNGIHEQYYDLLEDDAKTKVDKEHPVEGEDTGEGDGKKWAKVGDLLKEHGSMDAHEWSDGDVGEQEQLAATKDLLKRSLDKLDGSSFDEHAKTARDAIEEIDRKLKSLDCKRILLNTLRKSSPNRIRTKSWHRPNKHYGNYAKGTRNGKYPSLYFLIDTSGSISMKEANEFLGVVNQFMTSGVTKSKVGLFHTDLYKVFSNVKRNFKLSEDSIQIGGTCLTTSMQKVIDEQPDLVVILTDGYFGMPNINTKKLPELVTVISEGGDLNHPLAKFAKVINYKFDSRNN